MFTRIIFLSALFCWPALVSAATSREVRENSIATATVEPIGFSPYPGGGLRGGWILNPTLTLEAAYTSSFSNLGGSSRYIFSQVDVLGRFFLGNSFNIATGPGYRQVRINFAESDGDKADYDGVRARVGVLGVNATIGNQWQLGRVTIGCDWFGFFQHMTTVAEEKTGTKDLDDEQLYDVENEMDHQAELFRPSFVRFHIGMAF